MVRRKRTPEDIKSPEVKAKRLTEKAYIPLDEYTSASFDNLTGINRSEARWRRDYSDLLPGISGRPGLTREDYDYFRPDEATPKGFCDIVRKCNNVYRNVGLIRNVIDLMGDFTCQGIRLVHPNKRIEQFHKSLWELWRGSYTSERIANTLYRLSNVPIQYYTTKLTPTELEKLYRSTAAPDIKGLPKRLPEMESRELPFKYVILDPATVVPIGGELASFMSRPTYGILMSGKLRSKINSPATEEEKAIVAKLPDDLKEAAKNNRPHVLNPERTVMLHYKKDDWQMYADPMIYAVLDDIEVLEKLKLADLSALDGATAKIRIFRLGSVEHKIAPSPAMADKLSEILQNNAGSGCTDIVWGPDIDILETATDSFNFLGEARYQGTLNNIYAGLGIPPTLTGTFGAAGTTNNFISLKTLTERLEYGRSVLTSFWNQQLKIVQKTMGFRYPARVVFDRMILGNEDAEKALLIQLADRNLISDEMIQHIFKNDPDMERVRLKREMQERETGKRVPKAGSWHDPQPQLELAKIALTSGQATPSEVGLELKNNKEGEEKMLDKNIKLEEKKLRAKPKTAPGGISPSKKPKGRSGQGRPKNKKDSQKRKSKTFRARSLVESWVRDAQATISTTMTPAFLHVYKKKNMRQLSSEQAIEAEKIKFGVLCSYEPLQKVNSETIGEYVDKGISKAAMSMYNTFLGDFVQNMGRQPTMEETRNLQISTYLALNLDEENN